MIDPKELRIGSHVNLDNKRAKIVCLEPYSKIFPCSVEAHRCGLPTIYHLEDMHDLEPIPITEELLTELGFEEKINCGIQIFEKQCEAYAVRFIDDGNVFWRCNCYADNNLVCRVGIVRRISYLHQAEQMLSVYGIELIKE